jgi:hypothetical protein
MAGLDKAGVLWDCFITREHQSQADIIFCEVVDQSAMFKEK